MSEKVVQFDSADRLTDQSQWLRLAIIGGLFIWLHWHALVRLENFARNNPAWSHAYLIPLISLTLLWHKREQIAAQPAKTWWLGLPVFLATTLLFFFSFYPLHSTMLLGYTMVLNLCALILWLNGINRAKYILPAAAYLAFGVKIDAFLWETISWQLQGIAAWLSHVMINVFGFAFGIQSKIAGTQIMIFWQEGQGYAQGALNVSESCSGLQYLMAFMAIGVAIAALSKKPKWIRVTLVLMTVPVAIAVNVARVTIQGLLYPKWPELVHGDAHMFLGMLMLLPALLLFLLISSFLDRVYIQEETREELEG